MLDIRTKTQAGLYAQFPLFLSDFNQNWSAVSILVKLPNIKFSENSFTVSRVVSWVPTDEQTDGRSDLLGSLLDSESLQKGLAMPELFQHNIRARGNGSCFLFRGLLHDAVSISVYMVRRDRMVGEYCDMTPEGQNSEVRIRIDVRC
jgi:hypothetical protein